MAGKEFLIVTPGVRPRECDPNDQRRLMTPAEAIRAGSDFLVVGRPIIESSDPVKATLDILKEMNEVEAARV